MGFISLDSWLAGFLGEGCLLQGFGITWTNNVLIEKKFGSTFLDLMFVNVNCALKVIIVVSNLCENIFLFIHIHSSLVSF